METITGYYQSSEKRGFQETLKAQKAKRRVHWREPLNDIKTFALTSPVKEVRRPIRRLSTRPAKVVDKIDGPQKGFMASFFSACKKIEVSENSTVNRKHVVRLGHHGQRVIRHGYYDPMPDRLHYFVH
ncbi:hypothetical protein SUGI_0478630 [Cryptomeria japonica]|nr:hypothetical protein SUGI_0478630 [Cryptomeria japonica]